MDTLALMQPYFLPYLGYFSLIKHTDQWFFLDQVQFIRHGWIARNRILKPEEGWQYIIVPLKKHHHDIIIKDVKIFNSPNWQDKIFRQLFHYKKKAPFYNDVINLLIKVFDKQTDSIVDLDVYAIRLICEYIAIEFNYSIYSQDDITIFKTREADDLALEISKALGIKSYYNLIGGKSFYNKSKYERENIDIKFLKLNLYEYNQRKAKFEPGLSIIDVMMFNSPDTICKMLDDYELE
jgi:hypothetical protein